MFNLLKRGAAVLTLLWGMPMVYAQQATEIYIPVGKSAGLSGKYTSMGKISAVNAHDQILTVTDSAGAHNVQITPRTKIWLDKSNLRLTNQKGTFEDLEKDLQVEVKYEGNQRKEMGPAEWIKVRVTAPPGRN